MIENMELHPAKPISKGLPRRDWILIPLVGILTVLFLVVAVSALGWLLFPQVSPDGYASIYDCVRGIGPTNHMSGNANAVCRGNGRDEPVVEYRLNSRGHRAGMELGPKTPGTYRIVMIGSSYAIGEGMEMDQSLASLLPKELTSLTGRKVELYNYSMYDEFPDSIASHFQEVIATNPDLVLWILTKSDISESTGTNGSQFSGESASRGNERAVSYRNRRIYTLVYAVRKSMSSIREHISYFLHESPPSIMLKTLLFERRSHYIQSYLISKESGYLEVSQNRSWSQHLDSFENDQARVETQAQSTHTPVVTVFIPDRAQSAIISVGSWAPSYDPYKLDNQLHSIALKHGGVYLDIIPDFRTIPNPEQFYFKVSNHPTAKGEAIISHLIANHLTNGSISALDAKNKARMNSAQGIGDE